MYFVKVVSKATDDNQNFAGQKSITLYGKNETWIMHVGSAAESTRTVRQFNESMARLYGYKRECDAKRSYMYKHPDNSKYWTSEASIVQIDC